MKYSKSELMLKYQKAKVKLVEYSIPEEQYPKFPLNYRDLAFPTILILSRYAEAVIEENMDLNSAKKTLGFCAEYYDAALKSREQQKHDFDFILTGAIAYFFQDSFGSSMALLKLITESDVPEDARGILVDIFNIIFWGRKVSKKDSQVVCELEKYITTGEEKALLESARTQYEEAFAFNEVEAFFSEVIYAVIKIAISKSAIKLLPIYSNLAKDKWDGYLKRNNSIKIIWPSQQLIGEMGILTGENAIIQLPTGVGKTKSIELIIRSMFLAERGSTALVVAPLRSLCNEISDDMRSAFKNDARVNQFSDLFEIDFKVMMEEADDNRILVCTPEKLQFIFHHEPEIIQLIDLLVFDEGHMFDDESRGVNYELLISDIKQMITDKQQIVILSAVMSNSDEIANWLFGKNGVVAFDEKIKSTPKVVGFASKEETVHYYSNSFSDEDFFIPNTINKMRIIPKKQTAKPKFFPERKANDMALYYTNLLCPNGGVAIYVSQRRFIPTILGRLVYVADRGIKFSNLENSVDFHEANAIINLLELYYGDEHEYVKAAKKGLFAHYSSLPNGVRVSIEEAFRKNKIKAIVCTSTLAQGVNIPIKYMIMTSLNSAQKMISIRNFQNLMGRTARSGIYTEGSILISDPTLYDSKGSGRGYYIWNDAVSLFDTQKTEKCGSAILNLVRDCELNYEYYIPGIELSDFIVAHINQDIEEQLSIEYLSEYKKSKNVDQRIIKTAERKFAEFRNTIGVIENELCFIAIGAFGNNEISEEEINKVAIDKMKDTLAYCLAEDAEKRQLEKIFLAIASRVKMTGPKLKKIARSIVDINLADEIVDLIENKELNTVSYSNSELMDILVSFYSNIYSSDKITNELCNLWISGSSYNDMSKQLNIKIFDLEKIISQDVTYNLCFLVGNIIDYLEPESVNLERLLIIQKQLKFGVKSKTAISICQKIFNDRIISNILLETLNNPEIEEDNIAKVLKGKRDEVLEVLEQFPSYFKERIIYLS